MESSRLIASIAIALDKLQIQREQSVTLRDRLELGINMYWLCAVRTFCFYSTMLAYNVELRAECNNDDAVTSLRSLKRKMKEKKSRMRKSLGSLLVRVEDVICRIMDTRSRSETSDLRYEMRSCDEEMDEWYVRWSVFLKKFSTSHVASQIKAFEDSVFEDLKDFPSSGEGDDDLQFIVELRQIEAFKNKITVMRKIICYGTLLCTETQDFQCLSTQLEPLAISAAHLAQRHFSNMEGPMDLPSDLTRSMLSSLLLKFNPLLHEKYTLTLSSSKHSLEPCHPTLNLNDYPFIMKMERCIVSLLSTLSEMQRLSTKMSLKELLLYDRLRLLRFLLKRQPDRFNNDKIRNLTAAIVGDAGVRIFSFYQKDSVTGSWLQCVLENSEVIWGEVLEENVMETLTFSFPKTNVLGFLDFLLEDYLMEVNSSNLDSKSLSCEPKIREHLGFLKSFMGKLVELRNRQEDLHQDVWDLAVQVAYKIELLIDQLVLGDVHFSISLQSITEHIMNLKAASLNIFNNEGKQETFFKVQEINPPSTDEVPSVSSKPVADEFVGFESEKALIVNRLMTGFKKLQVFAIVGMPGLGKTTLATKVYRDSSITRHFPLMAWCSISQVFDRRKVLLELLNQIQPDKSDSKMNEEELSQNLWRSLRKRRYLIFIDDIWDTEAFDLLKGSLPDDSNKSRILLTSRHGDVVSEDLLDDKPLFLRHLTVDESLEMLQRKLFPAQKVWSSALHEFGMEIAEYCKGLPLIVVIIAGILKTMEQEGWQDVLKSLRSSTINSDLTYQCESTIELSYKHLPDHLKPCFLWFGAFPEDHVFSVKELIWLWIAEGLVRKSESKKQEDVAAGYLEILIGRSLVIRVKERSIGGVKACRIHDLLHDFCLKKAKEDNFLQLLKRKGDGEQRHLSMDEFEQKEPCDEWDCPRRLSIHGDGMENHQLFFFFPGLRSLTFCPPYSFLDLSLILRISKLLRVLDVRYLYYEKLPSEVGLVVQLRYLAMHTSRDICPAIGQLSNLETLIFTSMDGVYLPADALWNLQKLRHLYSERLIITTDDSDSSCKLLALETLSTLFVSDWSETEKQLRKFPNIRRIKCEFGHGYGQPRRYYRKRFNKQLDSYLTKVVDFSFLDQLESLSLFYSERSTERFAEIAFPEKMKKLTLRGTKFPWNEMARIAELPYLEVLKLRQGSFVGDTWHVEEGEFPKLKFLKLNASSLVRWTASDEVFPNLERLVLLDDYDSLEEIPESLESVVNLKTIEVDCSDHVASLVRKIEEFQKDMGNSALQIFERQVRQGY